MTLHFKKNTCITIRVAYRIFFCMSSQIMKNYSYDNIIHEPDQKEGQSFKKQLLFIENLRSIITAPQLRFYHIPIRSYAHVQMQVEWTLNLILHRPHPSKQANSSCSQQCMCNGDILTPLKCRYYWTIELFSKLSFLLGRPIQCEVLHIQFHSSDQSQAFRRLITECIFMPSRQQTVQVSRFWRDSPALWRILLHPNVPPSRTV